MSPRKRKDTSIDPQNSSQPKHQVQRDQKETAAKTKDLNQGWMLPATNVANQATSHISVQRDELLLGWQSTEKNLWVAVIKASVLHLLQ